MTPYPKRSTRRAGVLTLLVVGALSLLAGSTSGAVGLPVSPIYLGASAAGNGLKIRPATIAYTGDGTGFIGGANPGGHNGGIKWTKWTSALAVGTGFNQLDDCNPSCAGGRFTGYRVSIELWRPRRLGGRLVFTRLTIFYTQGRPAGEPRHYTFTDTYSGRIGGGYGWGPPTAQGYCTHTYGQAPAAGCQNIKSVP